MTAIEPRDQAEEEFVVAVASWAGRALELRPGDRDTMLTVLATFAFGTDEQRHHIRTVMSREHGPDADGMLDSLQEFRSQVERVAPDRREGLDRLGWEYAMRLVRRTRRRKRKPKPKRGR